MLPRPQFQYIPDVSFEIVNPNANYLKGLLGAKIPRRKNAHFKQSLRLRLAVVVFPPA